jgi:RHH-type proline utilization regulon transcriptional repressor/proline dehydrogenase/delta 1-pyrroline-5-carboxylate dehydrogenase
VLCLQEDVADRVLAMLKGTLEELTVGNPDKLATDVGPVISPGARDRIVGHVEAMRRRGRAVHQFALAPEAAHGTFVPPTIIEIDSLSDLRAEVFGPVLHVVRVPRDKLEQAVEAVNATGYGLTFGVHSRIDETVARVTARSTAGNIYVNRNLIGAVVGVQPFGGHGLSGTGPKAGGPLYLRRLLADRLAATLPSGWPPPAKPSQGANSPQPPSRQRPSAWRSSCPAQSESATNTPPTRAALCSASPPVAKSSWSRSVRPSPRETVR